jgi:putative protease
MVKKKAKKVSKARKTVKAKTKKKKAKAKAKEKVLGMVEHFFGKISVAAIKVKAPIRVGDVVRIKGSTTDFVQKIESMQIEHQNVLKARKGDEIGIKVRGKVRENDIVCPAVEEKKIIQPIFPPSVRSAPAGSPPRKESKKTEKSDPYAKIGFLRF